MHNPSTSKVALLFPLLLIVFSSCTTLPTHPPAENRIAFTIKEDETLLTRYAPVFVIENPRARHNLIGTPSAELTEDNKERIYTTPSKATVYTEERRFSTPKGDYTNLVYRIHFENVPGGLLPYYLGKGENVGLIVMVTLNSHHEPILYTSAHTCGCYLAFVPTSHMPEDGFPSGWQKSRQTVHSESLPGILDVNGEPSDPSRVMILLREDTHRVKDMWTVSSNALNNYRSINAETQSLTALEVLPLKQGGTTSFYETSGPRKGYVKGSQKSRERLLMSWWAFDWRIGEDKKFGANKQDGIQLYTSLKPWAREASDIRDFPTFLTYWKWGM